MLSITEQTQLYLDSSYVHQVKQDLTNAMFVLQEFGLEDWENELIDLISAEEAYDKEEIHDLFLIKVKVFILDLLKKHGVRVNIEEDPALWELNELGHFLLMVQKLEDTDYLAYCLYGPEPPRTLFIQMASRLTQLSEPRMMQLVEHVQPELIEAMKQLVKEDGAFSDADVTRKWKAHWDAFMAFVDNTECAGKAASEKGFGRTEFQTLYDLSGINWDFKVQQSELSQNHALLALDILSFVMFSFDGQQAPLVVFDKHISKILSTTEQISRIRPIVLAILKDFDLHRSATKHAQTLLQ